MAKLFTTEEQLTDMVLGGIKARLKGNISKKLHEIIDPEIEAIAAETAQEIASKVVSYNDAMSGRILLTVLFNQKEKIKDRQV